MASRIDEAVARLDTACKPRSLAVFSRADVLVLLAAYRREKAGREKLEADFHARGAK